MHTNLYNNLNFFYFVTFQLEDIGNEYAIWAYIKIKENLIILVVYIFDAFIYVITKIFLGFQNGNYIIRMEDL